jgi:hypothetical protein
LEVLFPARRIRPAHGSAGLSCPLERVPSGHRRPHKAGSAPARRHAGALRAAGKPLNAVILIRQLTEKNLGSCSFNELRRSFVVRQ